MSLSIAERMKVRSYLMQDGQFGRGGERMNALLQKEAEDRKQVVGKYVEELSRNIYAAQDRAEGIIGDLIEETGKAKTFQHAEEQLKDLQGQLDQQQGMQGNLQDCLQGSQQQFLQQNQRIAALMKTAEEMQAALKLAKQAPNSLQKDLSTFGTFISASVSKSIQEQKKTGR